ncbi:MAG: hypothetical protein HY909_25960 [Deltaproteobacteria bacterium]|nr:hypothetical protein [Deltaproteobacteria bacterium]
MAPMVWAGLALTLLLLGGTTWLLHRDTAAVDKTAAGPPSKLAVWGGLAVGAVLLGMGFFTLDRAGFFVRFEGVVRGHEVERRNRERTHRLWLRVPGGERALDVPRQVFEACRDGDRVLHRPFALGLECAGRPHWNLDPVLGLAIVCAGAYALRFALEDLRRRRERGGAI